MGNAAPRRNALQEEQRARTRALILQAALKVFSDVGYVGSSIEHILVGAGVSRAAFYSHFDGKLSVVQAIAEDFEPAWHPTFHHLSSLQSPDLSSLTEWAARYLDFHRSNQATCVLLSQVAVLEEAMSRQIAAQVQALIAMLAKNMPAFAAAKDDENVMLEASIVLRSVDQICFHVVHQHLPDPGNVAPRIMASQMLNFLQSHGS